MKRIQDNKLNYWLKLWGLVLLVCASLYLLSYWLFPKLQDVLKLVFSALSPFLLGWLVAFLIEPAVSFLTRRCRFKRSVASLCMVLLAIVVIALLLACLGIWIAVEIYHFSQNLPEVSQTIGDLLNRLSGLYDDLLASSWDTAAIQNWVESQGGKVSQGVASLLESALAVLWSTPSALLSLLVTILAAFFISKDRDVITNTVIHKLFRQKAAMAMRVYEYSVTALSGFIHAQVVLMLLIAAAGCVGFTILGVGSPIGMGILVAVVDVMPVLGPGLIMVPWMIISLIGGKFGTAVGLLVVYVVLTLIRQVLQPKLIADSLEVHPLLVLVGMVVGLAYMGVWGLILGPMIIVVVKSVLDARKKIG